MQIFDVKNSFLFDSLVLSSVAIVKKAKNIVSIINIINTVSLDSSFTYVQKFLSLPAPLSRKESLENFTQQIYVFR